MTEEKSNHESREEEVNELQMENEGLDKSEEGESAAAEGENNTEISEEDKLRNELAEAKDKYLRLYSEFENFRRRTAKERLDLIKTANEELMLSLLPVLDDFGRANKSFENKETDIKAVKEGVKLVSDKFQKVLEQKGLKMMDNKEGIDFNPDLHEAITQIPAPKKKLVGKVVDVIENGYFLGEKVIRYAKVVIGQ